MKKKLYNNVFVSSWPLASPIGVMLLTIGFASYIYEGFQEFFHKFLKKFVEISLKEFSLLFMIIVKKYYLKSKDKYLKKISINRNYSTFIDDSNNNNIFAKNHTNQVIDFFQTDYDNTLVPIYEIVKTNNLNGNYYSKVPKILNSFKFFNDVNKDYLKILKCKNIYELRNSNSSLKYFKDLYYLKFNFFKQLEINEGLLISGCNMNIKFNSIYGVIIGNFTTSPKNSIRLTNMISNGVLKGKVIYYYDNKYIILTAKDLLELLNLYLFLKEMKFNNKEFDLIKNNSIFFDVKSYLLNHNKYLLESVGLKNVIMKSDLITLKMIDTYISNLIDKWKNN